MPILTLVRGLPGSGKSTVAKALAAQTSARVIEADMFFETEEGYLFQPRLIKEAHGWCYRNTRDMLENGHDVIVANTFSQKWEMDYYLELQDAMPNLKIVVVECHGRFQNIHGVPVDTIEKMAQRWEPFRSEWLE